MSSAPISSNGVRHGARGRARREEILRAAIEVIAERGFRGSSIAAFAEDYWIVPTEQGCHLTWVMAMQPNGVAARLGMRAGKPVMAWLFQRFLHNLRRYTDRHHR